MSTSEYLNKELKAVGLVGSTITNTVLDGEGYDCHLGLVIRTAGGEEYVLWVQQDPEGNGPGFLQKQKL